MFKNGIDLIRVREKPLPQICPKDIIVSSFIKKDDINNLLLILIDQVSDETKRNIRQYILKDNFQNETLYRTYLDCYPSPLLENSLLYTHPEIAQKWDPHKNFPLLPESYTAGSNIKVWWQCSQNHSYRRTINHMTSKNGVCPYCIGRKVCIDNCLEETHPEIAKLWHPTKNNELTPQNFTRGSHKKVWWICLNGHESQATIQSKTSGSECIYCLGKKISEINRNISLGALFPKLIQEWHPTKNLSLTPFDISKKSSKKVWWVCPKGHEYQAIISNKTNGSGCPCCYGRLACKDNCLETLYPKIAEQWHPTKNFTLTPKNVTKGSHKIIWWVCTKGHQYQQSVKNKVNNNILNCPICRKNQNK